MAFKLFGRRDAADTAPAVKPAEPETRAAGTPTIGDLVRQSDPGVGRIFGLGDIDTAGETVTPDTALQVPAFSCGVAFLSRTLAALPKHVFDKTDDGRVKRTADPLAALLNEAPNDEASAFDFWRAMWQDVFTEGRGVAFIERNRLGRVINLWPLNIGSLRVERRGGRTIYHYRDGGRSVTYAASEVIDLKFMPGANGLSARSPVYMNAGTFGLALAITRYGRRFFNNGGVPPFTIEGPFSTAGSVERAGADLTAAVKQSADKGELALALPAGHSIKSLGVDPEKMQMHETQRFLIEEIARILGLPPVFLQDLTRGTYSNVEQQDLNFIKHSLVHWLALWEGEVNLKLFGRGPRRTYAENAVAGIARGDLKTRADAIARQVSTGQLTPNEARELENRPAVEGGDQAFMQGAMAPLDKLAKGEGSGLSASSASPNGEGNPADDD